jgi:putative effector of murein hydrolase
MNSLYLIISLLITLAIYSLFLKIYSSRKYILFHPNIATTIILIFILYLTKIPFEYYNTGGQYITYFLGICIVVLAVPMYQTLQLLKENIKLIVFTSLVSIYTSFFSMMLIARILNIPKSLVFSLIPKSITSAMAIEASKMINGSEAIAILGVMITGIMGAIIGRFVLDRINIINPIARGCSLGMSAHVMGTTQALEEGEITGSFSALSIPVTGVLTILNLPLFILLIEYILK